MGDERRLGRVVAKASGYVRLRRKLHPRLILNARLASLRLGHALVAASWDYIDPMVLKLFRAR